MTRLLPMICLLCLTGIAGRCIAQQDAAAEIRTHAVNIPDPLHLSDTVWQQVQGYHMIFVGEAHGSLEPAQFVQSLTHLFLRHKRKVLIGMEIPLDWLSPFDSLRTDSSLAHTRFMRDARRIGDGRSSTAWAALMLAFRDSGKVQYVFFDGTRQQYAHTDDRDSLMAINILHAQAADPGAVFIGLSGGYHDLFDPETGHHSALWYVLQSPQVDSTKVLNLDVEYDSGTMNCNSSEPNDPRPTGLKLHTYPKGMSGIFGRAVDLDHYLLIGPYSQGYKGIYFTRILHPSMLWVEDGK